MNDRRFSLQPFSPAGRLTDAGITGVITRRSNTIIICYALHSRLDELMIASPAASPSRKNGLWEETCFEFFLGVKNSDRYWEFNLSPSGDWNVYRFDAYRLGIQQEGAFAAVPFHVQRRSDSLELDLELDLDKIVPVDASIDVAVSAVVKDRHRKMTYWALTHHGPQADFHRRDGFIIEFS